jgi:hypothetical protein
MGEQENPDGLVDRLRLGCVYRPKRWSGDTHTDLGGSVDEEATDALMADAADLIDALLSDDVLTDPVMPRGKIIGRLVFDRSTPENTAEPVAAAVHTRPEHTTAGHWMPMPENTAHPARGRRGHPPTPPSAASREHG